MKRADLDLDPSKVQQLARTAETEAYERAESPVGAFRIGLHQLRQAALI